MDESRFELVLPTRQEIDTLAMKEMDINDLMSFDFIDLHTPQTLIFSIEQLYSSGALDKEGLSTKLCRKMVGFSSRTFII